MQLLQTSTPFLRTSHNPSIPSAVLPVVFISIKSYLNFGVITATACAYALMVDSVQAKAALPLTNVLYSMLVWPSLTSRGFFDQTLCVFCASPVAENTAIRLKLSRMREANLFMKSSWRIRVVGAGIHGRLGSNRCKSNPTLTSKQYTDSQLLDRSQ